MLPVLLFSASLDSTSSSMRWRSSAHKVHKALWAKLRGGETTVLETTTGWVDNEPESIHHSIYHCHFLTGAFEVIDTAFRLSGTHPISVRHLLQYSAASSLETPAGILGWSALFTNWSLRCKKEFSGFYRITWETFCRQWEYALSL